MARLTYRSLRKLSGLIRRIYSVLDEKKFPADTVSVVSEAIPSLIVSYDENKIHESHQSRHLQYPYEVYTGKDLAILNERLHEHPFFSYHVRNTSSIEGDAIKLTDMITNNRFRNLGIYNEVFKKHGIGYQMTAPHVCNRRNIIDICFHRDKRDFSEEERLILNLLGPHIVQAYRNVEIYSKARQTLGGSDQMSENEKFNLLKSLGLSFREAEVLYWAAQGKTN